MARCNHREFCFTTPADFELLLAHLQEMSRTYDVTLYAYTLMANHIQLLLGAHAAKGVRYSYQAEMFLMATGRTGGDWR